MKISFWIPAIVLCLSGIVFSDSIDVGTVLFTTTDLVKRCWIDSDKSLLRARLIMQDVLPDPDYIDFSKPDIVMTLLDYFHSCYEIIRTSTCGNFQNLMLLALSDTLGGYLRAYVLPLTRRAYYAGQMNYSEAKKLFQMYDDIKGYLKTNGLGWTEPQYNCGQNFNPRPLVINEKGGKAACESLYTIEKKSVSSKKGKLNLAAEKKSLCRANPKTKEPTTKNERKSMIFFQNHRAKSLKDCEAFDPVNEESQNVTKKFEINYTGRDMYERGVQETSRDVGDLKKRLKDYYKWTMNGKETRSRFSKDLISANLTLRGNPTNQKSKRNKRLWGSRKKNQDKVEETKIVIPLPLLDDPEKPHAIAVPFKAQPLRNLDTQNSAFVLEHYYSTAIKCLVNKNQAKRDIDNFNAEFYSWLVSEVCPHLGDEQWYPGFGGVLRILETIKKFGSDRSSNDTDMLDVPDMFNQGTKFYEKRKARPKEKPKHKEHEEEKEEKEENEENIKKPSKYFICAILVIAVLGIMLFSSCIFYVYEMIKTTITTKRKGTPQPPPKVSNKKQNDLNFQFLIQFFKKKDKPFDEELPYDSDLSLDRLGARYIETKRKDIWVGRTDVGKPKFWSKEKAAKDDQNSHERTARDKKKTDPKHKERGQSGQGDGPGFASSNATAPQLDFSSLAKQIWPRRGSFARLEKAGQGTGASGADNAAGDGKKSRPAKDLDNKIETLWKTPSARFGRSARKEEYSTDSKTKDSLESSGTGKLNTGSDSVTASAEDGRKDDSSEKRSSSYGYSGSCSQSRVTTTYSSSQTQVEDKFSSATMEFFEKVIAKHKPFAKSSTQETTAESDTDGSYSSETDY